MFAPLAAPSTDLGHFVRISIRAEIEAVHVFQTDAARHGQSEYLAALEAHERELWDALANAQSL
ncbi:hypothetical protein DI005_20035 [Prauserella sp. PE36]|uniref:hypothetical protein n=1 Tax=Prauserella sp. PE36 TaxID=1504709 RepID=UPI000DE3AB68|nr:hypothetical protein [Prauserella sp. PE36]RBM18086.1 hypothetical protein DI005_20035 [Prauserella sp. PE36]